MIRCGRLCNNPRLLGRQRQRCIRDWKGQLEQKHPITRSHPETGRTALYVSPHTISEIVGLSAEKSRPILEEIYEFATQNRFVYEHRWTQNDVIMWDNRCTMHSVGSYDSARYRRVMLRATVSGDAPVER